jgi:hypothetical protein
MVIRTSDIALLKSFRSSVNPPLREAVKAPMTPKAPEYAASPYIKSSPPTGINYMILFSSTSTLE